MDRSTDAWILGGYQSDFARNLTKEGHDFAALTAEVVGAALASAKMDATDIGVVHVGNAYPPDHPDVRPVGRIDG